MDDYHIRDLEKEMVGHLTDVHKASSSSTYCLLADDPHDQLTILNVHPRVVGGNPLVGTIVLSIVVRGVEPGGKIYTLGLSL